MDLLSQLEEGALALMNWVPAAIQESPLSTFVKTTRPPSREMVTSALDVLPLQKNPSPVHGPLMNSGLKRRIWFLVTVFIFASLHTEVEKTLHHDLRHKVAAGVVIAAKLTTQLLQPKTQCHEPKFKALTQKSQKSNCKKASWNAQI